MKKTLLLMMAMLLSVGVKAETEEVITSTSTELKKWESNESPEQYMNLSYDDKGALANSFMNDKISITYTTKSGQTEYDLKIANPDGWADYTGASTTPTYSASAQTYEYAIPNAKILESIQQRGIIIRGHNVTVTSVKLIKVDNRYDAVPLTIGGDEICTFGCSKNLDFSSIQNVVPYYASEVSTGQVTLVSVTITKAWAGYIIKGPQGDYDVPVTATVPEWIDAFNNLITTGDYDGYWVYKSVYSDYTGGGDRESQIKNKYRYIFAKKNSSIGFYKLPTNYSEGDKPYHVLNRHKAFLETATDITPTTPGAPALLFFNDSETTGINTTKGSEFKVNDNVYYDLSGRRVAKPTKGLYIVNGKKVVIK